MAIETQNGYPSIRITAGERVLTAKSRCRRCAGAGGSLAFSGRS